ncbi:recombinase family protein [Lacrimispora sp. 38-1]
MDKEFKIVRMIFDLYFQGLTFGQIKTYLESMGVRT